MEEYVFNISGEEIQQRLDAVPGKADKSDTYTKTEVDGKLALKADKSDTYTKQEVDAELANKADKADTYTKQEVDAELAKKADKADTYTKTEVDAELANKADKADTYTKTEVDGELAKKADKADTYTKTEVDAELDKKANVSDVYDQQEITRLFAQEANEILLFGGILTDSDIDVRQQSYGGSVDVANIFWSTYFDCFVYKYLPLPTTPETQPVYYTNFGGRDKYSDNDFQPYTGKLYQNINTEDYYYHLDNLAGLKMLEPKVSDMEKPVLWFNGVGIYLVQQTGISETGSWENVVYDLDSDKFVYKKVTSSGGVEKVTYYNTWLNEGLYNDSTTRMPRKGVIFFNAVNSRFYNLSAQSTFEELNSGPTIEQYNALVQTVDGKEQRMVVVSVSTLEQTSVQLSLNLYHDFRNVVGVLDVHLPTTGIGRNVASCVLHLTTDSAPAISFYFTSVADAHISYQEGFAIEANSEYEINCLWNGGQWFIAAMKIAASSSASTNSNNE